MCAVHVRGPSFRPTWHPRYGRLPGDDSHLRSIGVVRRLLLFDAVGVTGTGCEPHPVVFGGIRWCRVPVTGWAIPIQVREAARAATGRGLPAVRARRAQAVRGVIRRPVRTHRDAHGAGDLEQVTPCAARPPGPTPPPSPENRVQHGRRGTGRAAIAPLSRDRCCLTPRGSSPPRGRVSPPIGCTGPVQQPK